MECFVCNFRYVSDSSYLHIADTVFKTKLTKKYLVGQIWLYYSIKWIEILENCQFLLNLKKSSKKSSNFRFQFYKFLLIQLKSVTEFIMVKIQVIMRILFHNRRWAVQNAFNTFERIWELSSMCLFGNLESDEFHI